MLDDTCINGPWMFTYQPYPPKDTLKDGHLGTKVLSRQ